MTKKPKTTKKGRKIGRPSPHDAVDVFHMRLSDSDREIWESKARLSGMQLSQWARYHLARVAGGTAAIVGVEFRTSYPPHGTLTGDGGGGVVRLEIPALDAQTRDIIDGLAVAVARLRGGDQTVGRQRATVQTDLRALVESFIDRHQDRVLAQELAAELDRFDREPPVITDDSKPSP